MLRILFIKVGMRRKECLCRFCLLCESGAIIVKKLRNVKIRGLTLQLNENLTVKASGIIRYPCYWVGINKMKSKIY